MRLSGFTFVRNGVKYDYPFLESITCLLALCDEVIVAVGRSEDDTLERITSLHAPNLKIIETVWDESLRQGGSLLAQQTNIALDQVRGDWALYLQADEILHEKDFTAIKETITRYKDEPAVEGFLFSYKHFFGSYSYIGNSRRWYRREIRIVRPHIGVHSWGDAQGFRMNGQKLHVKLLDASVYHYGWVKPPAVQQQKQRSFHRLWHSDEWIRQYVGKEDEYDYRQGGLLKAFDGTHPAVMEARILNQNWTFSYNPKNVKRSIKEKILDSFESATGRRIGEYKNYILI